MIIVNKSDVESVYKSISDTVRLEDGLNVVCGLNSSFEYSLHGLNLSSLVSGLVASNLVYVITKIKVGNEDIGTFELNNPDAVYVGNRFLINEAVYTTIGVINKDNDLHSNLHKFGISLGFVDLSSNSVNLTIYTDHYEEIVVCGKLLKTTNNKLGFIDMIVFSNGESESIVHLGKAFKNKDVFLNMDDYEKYRHNVEIESGSIRMEKEIREMKEELYRKEEVRKMEIENSKREHAYKMEQYKEKDEMRKTENENDKREHRHKVKKYKKEYKHKMEQYKEKDEMRKVEMDNAKREHIYLVEQKEKEYKHKMEQYKEKDEMRKAEMDNAKREHIYLVEQKENEIREKDELRKIREQHEIEQSKRIVDLEFILDIRSNIKKDKELKMIIETSDTELNNLDRRLEHTRSINMLNKEDTLSQYEHSIGSKKAKILFDDISNVLEFEEINRKGKSSETLRKLKSLQEEAKHKHAIGEVLTDIEYKNIEETFRQFHSRDGDDDDGMDSGLGDIIRDGLTNALTNSVFKY